MILRGPCVSAIMLCLQGCITWSPQASTPVPLNEALRIVARDLNAAAPVVLSDTKNAAQPLRDAIKARQCATGRANPPLPVITGPISLQLQGTFTGQAQGGFPTAFQLQATRAQQQQLTVPITFVPASALSNFFLGQNVPNVSGVPTASQLNDNQYSDNITLIKQLLVKAAAIGKVANAQIADYKRNQNDAKYCEAPPGQDLNLVAADVSILIPQAVKGK